MMFYDGEEWIGYVNGKPIGKTKKQFDKDNDINDKD